MTLIAALLAVLAPAVRAAPSRFVYEICDPTLTGGAGTTVGVLSASISQISASQTCSLAGGSIGLQQTGRSEVGSVVIDVAVPHTPGGFVESETMISSARGLGGVGGERGFVFEPGWPPEGVEEARASFEVPAPAGSTEWGGDFRIGMECLLPGRCVAGPGIGARYIAATEVDPDPPVLTAAGGPLLGEGVQRGHEELSAQVADLGGGVAKVEVLVDGVPADQPDLPTCALAKVANPGYSGTVALSPTPCPASVTASWDLDTTSYPFEEGANEVQVCASDLATLGDPNRTCSAARTVTVDDSCTESPVGGGANLSAEFTRSKGTEVTVPFGTGAQVTGELQNASGEAVSGATICVQSATQGSTAGLSPTGTATTDSNGRFSYAVGGGPDRQVLLGYRHGSFEIARSVRYYAHVRPTIRLSAAKVHDGAGIRLTGRLPGGPQAAGRVVVLKASALHSRRWYPFGETTTNADGVYHYRYRFDATTRTTTYRMEAVVPPQDHYPFKGGHSKPALVEVKG